MIVATNTYIPALSGTKKAKKGEKPIATTEAGDVAFYRNMASTLGRGGGLPDIDDDDDDGDDEYDDFEIPLKKRMKKKETSMDVIERPVSSLTGAKWRPNFTDRLTMFIAGAPGAGKSYLAKEMINLLPSNLEILLFTALEENDGNFDSLGKDRLYKIKMTPEVLSKISLKEIRERMKSSQAILLFDDVDKIRNPKVQAAVFAIMNDALANGRGHEKHDGKGDIHVICTSHSANDYQKTKYTFENSNYVALFPGSTPPLQMYRMFDKLGLDKELCKKMIHLGRTQGLRSIIIHKVVPMYMIYGDKIKLI